MLVFVRLADAGVLESANQTLRISAASWYLRTKFEELDGAGSEGSLTMEIQPPQDVYHMLEDVCLPSAPAYCTS